MRPWTADIYGYLIPQPSSWAGEESVTRMSFPVWRDIGAHCSLHGQDCWALGQPQVWWLCFLRRTGLVLIRPPLQESGGKEPRCRPCWAEAALVCCGELGEALYWDRQQASPWNGDPRRSGLGWAVRRSQPRSVSSSEQETEGTHLLYNSDFKFAWLEKWFAQWW